MAWTIENLMSELQIRSCPVYWQSLFPQVEQEYEREGCFLTSDAYPVSYTHLDVYKRQPPNRPPLTA